MLEVLLEARLSIPHWRKKHLPSHDYKNATTACEEQIQA